MFSVPISLLGTTQHSARTIVYCIQHQRRVVDDVLTLSKLDSDLLTVSPCPVQPVKLVREALEIFDGQLRTADINFKVEEDPSLQDLGIDWVVLDPGRVLQVLMSQSPSCQTTQFVFPKSSTYTSLYCSGSSLSSLGKSENSEYLHDQWKAILWLTFMRRPYNQCN